jgi:hypothetical protein
MTVVWGEESGARVYEGVNFWVWSGDDRHAIRVGNQLIGLCCSRVLER